ncbi:Gfo/Idh/MocA family oxidoreductase [Saccharibacillus sp. CPCC 101409]|uniref:Gfo/Idh/MocA family protein n=1 Tax=Saccharibacillus sp. CPCC 101409 TaxID=3058041 RepID=UPI0026740AC6|nr:Gfo/Idh/MocA family oxidoreductase [Saccharibacillus sp. CPCC 101409]MDO3409504.1 Gfo/Idh/MocA family oxidoreductase [Saccharibacillus sp. CPCC 101409]
MKRMKTGIIGCGNISAIYLQNLGASEWIEVTAVADRVPEKARERAAEFGVATACTVEELLADESIELVINLTIPASHAAVALAAIEAGKHVYGEKPLAVSLEDAHLVLDEAKKRNLRVGCAPDTFLGAGVTTARRAIEEGLIGRPVAGTAFMLGGGPEGWHTDPEFFYAYGGGPMFDMGPYYLTALVNLLGPIHRVSASTGIQIPDRFIGSGPKAGTPISVQTPTHLAGTLDFAGGPIVTMIMSFDVRGATELPRMEIYGTAGTLSLPDPNFFGGDVRLRRAGSDNWEKVDPVFESARNERGLGVEDMVKCIREERRHRASGELAYHVLETMHAFMRSSADSRHITLDSSYKVPAARHDSLKL